MDDLACVLLITIPGHTLRGCNGNCQPTLQVYALI